jgi:hypothetical protein
LSGFFVAGLTHLALGPNRATFNAAAGSRRELRAPGVNRKVFMATAFIVMTTRADRANQRNAVLAGFLGWTLDAFDFFILTLILGDVARGVRKTRPQIALAITMTLAMRPIGADRLRHAGRPLRAADPAHGERRVLRGHFRAVRVGDRATPCS